MTRFFSDRLVVSLSFAAVVLSAPLGCVSRVFLALCSFVISYVCFNIVLGFFRYHLLKGELASRFPAVRGQAVLERLVVRDVFPVLERYRDSQNPGQYLPYAFEGAGMDGTPSIGVSDADGIKAILSNPDIFVKGELYSIGEYFIGAGLVTKQGAPWKSDRKLLTPLFHFHRLRSNLPRLVSLARAELQDRLQKKKPGSVELAMHVFSRLSLRNIIDVAFGGDFQVDAMVPLYEQVTHNFGAFLAGRLLFGPLFRYFPVPWARRFVRAQQAVEELALAAIVKRRQQLALHGLAAAARGASDLLTQMLCVRDEEGNGLTDKDILEQSKTFLFAGFDTTANALSWAVYLLAAHPEQQAALHAELDAAYGSGSGSDAAEPLDDAAVCEVIKNASEKLPFCLGVIQESMRLFPATPGITRVVAKRGGVTLPNGARLRRGTHVSVCVSSVHRDARHWREPNRFNPLRWVAAPAVEAADTGAEAKEGGTTQVAQGDGNSNNNGSSSDGHRRRRRHPFAYVPFSAGPRNCIGSKFATMAMTVALSLFLHTYRVEAVTQGRPAMQLNGVSSPGDYQCRFLPRRAAGAAGGGGGAVAAAAAAGGGKRQ